MAEGETEVKLPGRRFDAGLYGIWERKYPDYFQGAECSPEPDRVIYEGVRAMMNRKVSLNGEVAFLDELAEHYRDHKIAVKDARKNTATPYTDIMLRLIESARRELHPHGKSF